MYKLSDKIETKLEYILKHSSPNDLIENLKLFVEIETIDANFSQRILDTVLNIEYHANYNFKEHRGEYYDADEVEDVMSAIKFETENLEKLCEKFDTNLLTLQLENKLIK